MFGDIDVGGGKGSLRPSAEKVLDLLLEHRGLTTREIVARTNYKKATVCLALKSLSDSNLVSKRVQLERDARTYVWFALSRRTTG